MFPTEGPSASCGTAVPPSSYMRRESSSKIGSVGLATLRDVLRVSFGERPPFAHTASYVAQAGWRPAEHLVKEGVKFPVVPCVFVCVRWRENRVKIPYELALNYHLGCLYPRCHEFYW